MAHEAVEPGAAKPLSERGKIRRWRLRQFYRLGFDAAEARRLADSGADLALTRRLVQAGCDRDTALAIVL